MAGEKVEGAGGDGDAHGMAGGEAVSGVEGVPDVVGVAVGAWDFEELFEAFVHADGAEEGEDPDDDVEALTEGEEVAGDEKCDDRGGANDFIVVNGKKISSPIREEIVTIRGIVAGEYTVNVSHFVATTSTPVPVTVKVQKLNPTAQVIFDDAVFVNHTGDEKTAVRFTLDAEGKVTDVNSRQKSLMETFRNVRQNGADRDPKIGYVKQL